MYHKSGKVLLTAFVLLATVFAAYPAFAQSKNIEQIVAWVNSEIILKSEYDARLKEIRDELADPERGKLKGAQLEAAMAEQTKYVMQKLIDEALLLQKAKEMGLSADIEVVKAMDRLRQERKLASLEELEKAIVQQIPLEEFKQQLRVQYLTSEVLQREVYGRVVVSNEEMRKYYDAHVKDFDRPAGVRLREITVITENRGPEEAASQRKKVEEALAAVKKGDDFAEVAGKYSESQTAQEGGDLGFLSKTELLPWLADVTGKLQKGQVSDIVPVQGGFMIIKLDDKHDGGILPYELAQKEVQDILWKQGVQPKIKDYLTKLRADGFVKTADGYSDTGAPEKTDKVSAAK